MPAFPLLPKCHLWLSPSSYFVCVPTTLNYGLDPTVLYYFHYITQHNILLPHDIRITPTSSAGDVVCETVLLFFLLAKFCTKRH
jgi:hypothetical protein